jgi:hypothetical protein
MSGNKFPHYMLILFPIYADFAAAFIASIKNTVSSHTSISKSDHVYVFLIVLLLFACGQGAFAEMCDHMLLRANNIPDNELKFVQTANYIESNTDPGELFTVYNNNSRGAAIQNFQRDRFADTLVFVTYNYKKEWYNYNQAVPFLEAVKRNNRFFVNADNEPLPPDVAEYVEENYTRVECIKQVGIYEYNGFIK